MQQSDWVDLKDLMDTPYGRMELICDGFRVDLIQHINTKARSWHTEVYVDGSIKGEWLRTDDDGEPVSEEGRRFYRKTSKKLFSSAEIALHRKVHGKKAADKLGEKVITRLSWEWSSFSSLKKHLETHNTSIERVPGADY